MNQNVLAVLAIIGALAAVFLVVFAALAAYDAVSRSGMGDDVGDMVRDTGGMRGDRMGNMMDGMDGMNGMMGGGGRSRASASSRRPWMSRVERLSCGRTTIARHIRPVQKMAVSTPVAWMKASPAR